MPKRKYTRTKPVRPLIDRLMDKVSPEPNSGCWLFTGSLNMQGYGQIAIGNHRPRLAHIVAYELLVGPVPEGLELDHLCRNTICCNPKHCEPVTHQENCRRGNHGKLQLARTHCPQGHPYDEANTIHSKSRNNRLCRACQKEHKKNHEKRKRERLARASGSD